MKLTNGDIFMAREPLQVLLDQKFPVMVSYKLAQLSHKLQEQLKVIEEVRMGLVRKYGKKDKKGSIAVKQESENYSKFVEEFTELMEHEVEIKELEKVKLPERVASTCDACKHNMDKIFEIEPKILMALVKLVEV